MITRDKTIPKQDKKLAAMTKHNPELGETILTGDIKTNVHIQGHGNPVMLIHGSGPGVTAWANWRLVIPELAKTRQVIAPDMLGFGYTQRPQDNTYSVDKWIRHAIDILDALGHTKVDLIGNSFGGGLALALAIAHPERINRLVLMGSVGVSFPLTKGLAKVWGYTPSLENMYELLNIFAFDRNLVTDELAELRYKASIRDGFQESFAAMFPAPRQRWIESLASSDKNIRSIKHEALILHGREDDVIPLRASLDLFNKMPNAQLHVFGKCGHWTQIEHTARFCALVENFLSEQAEEAI